MDYGGLSPENRLLRWGNFDRTLLLPSTELLKVGLALHQLSQDLILLSH